jgi:hypothetical protein
MQRKSGERSKNETSNNNPAEPGHEGDTGLEKVEYPAGEKSKRGRPAGSKNAKKSSSQIENRNVDGPAHFCSAHITVEGGGGGGQEETTKGLRMQVDKLRGLLAAKRAYDEAIVSINKCVDAGALTSGEAEAQRAEADAALNAAKEAAGVAATRTEIDAQEGEEKENPAGEKSKRGRPAGSKNASKKNIYDPSAATLATLAAVCSDLELAPAVGSESSVRDQRIRDIHAATGSKQCSSQLENRNVDDLAASAGGGGGGREEASRPSKTEALKADKESAHVLSDFADDAAPPKSGDEHMRSRDACNYPDQQPVIRYQFQTHIH